MEKEEIWFGLAREQLGIIKRFKQGGRLLDIGCGEGFLLHETSGFEAVGVERDVHKAEYGNDLLGVRILPSDFFGLDIEGTFDVVTCNHVIEHIRNLRGFLRRVRGLLAEDGIFLVTTPNGRSLQSTSWGTIGTGTIPGSTSGSSGPPAFPTF